MLLSAIYLTILMGYILLKRNQKVFSYFLTSIGFLSLVLSGFISNSPTSGLKIIFNTLLFIGILLIVVALIRLFKNKSKEIHCHQKFDIG